MMMALGHLELLVELPAYGAHRAIADHCQSRADVHSRLGSLIDKPDTAHATRFNERLFHGHAGPDLHFTGGHQPAADKLHELSQRHYQAVMFPQEGRDIRQLHAGLARHAESPQEPVNGFEWPRTAACAYRVQKID